MRLLKNKKGLTLIEVIVTIFIAAIVLGMVASIVGFFSGFFGDETQQINRQENMRILVLNLEKDIRTSDQTITLSGGCYVIGEGDGSTPIHTYCFSNENKTVTRNGDILARNVDQFNLILTDSSTINIDIKMEKDTRDKIIEANYTIYLRQARN